MVHIQANMHACNLSSCALSPLNPVDAQYAKYKHSNHSNHGQYMYIHCNTDTAANIRSQCWCLLLVVSIYMTNAQNSFYHFRMAVTSATICLLAVAAFLSKVLCLYSWFNKNKTGLIMKGNDLLSRLHA